MEDAEDGIAKEIRLLIKDSCNFNLQPTKEYQQFHKIFLKFSFGVLDVEIDYESKIISTWNSKPSNSQGLDFRYFGDALLEKVSYTDLEETLMGCVGIGTFNERFYKHLLYEFDRIPNENGMKTA